jgi:DNA-binding transcriptional regulator GbsR (MarR family)
MASTGDVRQIVEELAMAFADWGFPRMPARVLVYAMSSDADGLTAADLAGALDVSPAAISGALKYLLHIGLLAKKPVPGSRRDVYVVPNDLWYEGSVLKSGFFDRVIELSRAGADALGGRETPGGRRLSEMAEFYRHVQSEMAGILERWHRKE